MIRDCGAKVDAGVRLLPAKTMTQSLCASLLIFSIHRSMRWNDVRLVIS